MIVLISELLASPIMIILLITIIYFVLQIVLYNYIFDSISILNLSTAFFSGYDPLNIVLSPSLMILSTFLLSEYLNLEIEIDQLWILGISMSVISSVAMILIGRVRLVLTFKWLLYSMIAIILAAGMINITNQSKPEIATSVYSAIWLVLMICLAWRTLINYGHEYYYQNALASALYKKYKKKYHYLLSEEMLANPELMDIFFTIMTIEQMNRPGVFRLFERIFFFTGKITTTGIMQVSSKKYLSNPESILAAQDIVLKQYRSYTSDNTSHKNLVTSIAFIYNPADSYIELINGAYGYLTSLDKKVLSIK